MLTFSLPGPEGLRLCVLAVQIAAVRLHGHGLQPPPRLDDAALLAVHLLRRPRRHRRHVGPVLPGRGTVAF